MRNFQVCNVKVVVSKSFDSALEKVALNLQLEDLMDGVKVAQVVGEGLVS